MVVNICSVIYFSRKYGIWVARHPTLVLCLSVSAVLLLCVGLVQFKVETKPDKVKISIFSFFHKLCFIFNVFIKSVILLHVSAMGR